MDSPVFDDEPPPEPREGWLLVRIYVPDLNIHKCLQFPSEKLVWDVKQQVLASLPKELKESFNYGLFCPPHNGRAGKFLDEERRLGDYPFNGPIGYFELKYKRRVYKMLNMDEKQLKAVHSRANLRRFVECVNGGHVEKVSKMCTKGLDPNFHCQETGETPLSMATKAKKPNKLLIALVNGGALLDYRTKDGVTALHRAVEYDSLEAVSTLLELGASPNYRDTKGITPIYLCVTKKSDPRICDTLLHDHATLGIADSQGWQEIHQACRHGLAQHLEHLLFYGADMDGRNASGNTPLHVCAVNNQEACARMLLFRGAQRDALNYANQTPYQVAVIADNLELAEIIKNYKSEDIVPLRGPPRYNPRRRSGLGWGNILSRIGGPPSPCPSDHPFSSASSEGSSSHRSHEDDVSIVTDKSIGDTSDIISDSSGVGTNSDSAACSIGHPSTTVVCFEAYNPTAAASAAVAGTPQNNNVGHLTINPGDVIEVVGSTDCGLLEGFVRGTNYIGFFPANCVQEVQFRQQQQNKGGGNGGIMNVAIPERTQYSSTSTLIVQHDQETQQFHGNGNTTTTTNNGAITVSNKVFTLTPTDKKRFHESSRKTVVLHRAKRGFGFILRGAKQSSPLMQSTKYPALQYLDNVDPGGIADVAGLKPGDFLVEINGEDVTGASHEHVVDLIRKSGSLVQMTVVPLSAFGGFGIMSQSIDVPKKMSSSYNSAIRQCSTLPRRLSQPGKLPAPAPPRRDPRTTLSVGRARAKSLVAGLDTDDADNNKEDGGDHVSDKLMSTSTSIEAMNHYHHHQQHYQTISGWSTPTQGPGTPTQLRTASIKSRPTSSRITAAELNELFHRQHSIDDRRLSGIATSRFHDDTYSPPNNIRNGNNSPGSGKGALVYASVADMKRKAKNKMSGTLRGRPVPIPTVTGELKRSFHSTPDLANAMMGSANSVVDWATTFKNHHSQDDVHRLQSSRSLTRLNLPPPDHPPPAPPVGQVVKVDVSRSEYECPANLFKKKDALGSRKDLKSENGEVMSSFKPDANAKLYASPQELKIMAIRRDEVMKKEKSPYEVTGQTVTPAPPIPDPDYSLSESEGEGETVKNVQIIQVKSVEYQEAGLFIGNATTTSGNSSGNSANSNASSGNGSISSGSQAGSVNKHSSSKGFCAEELSRIRSNLKSSKSSNSLTNNNGNAQTPNGNNKVIDRHEEGDNSSSGVSSDQEIDRKRQSEFPVTIVKGPPHIKPFEQKSFMLELSATTEKIMNGGGLGRKSAPVAQQPVTSTPVTTKVTNSIVARMQNEVKQVATAAPAVVTSAPAKKGEVQNASSVEERSDDDEDSPSPPSIGFQFQRHNSLTRKQAAIVAQRTKAMQHTMRAVSLAKLPPPIEHDDNEKQDMGADHVVVLAPPPEFCDFVSSSSAMSRPKEKPKFKTSRLHSQ